MTVAKVSSELDAPPRPVYDLISDLARLPEWDVSYESAVMADPDDEGRPTFAVRRTIANRGMALTCRIDRAEPPGAFTFFCTGQAGERLSESFQLTAGKADGSTEFTRELDYQLPGEDLGVVSELTYAEAWTQRTVEQAFARLNALLGATKEDDPTPAAPGETDTRTEDTGGISAATPYSAHRDAPEVPERPT